VSATVAETTEPATKDGKYLTPLVEFISPSFDLCGLEELYFWYNDKACFSYEENIFYCAPYGVIYFDRYFNSFSIGKWKSICEIPTLSFSIRIEGRFIVSFFQNRENQSHRKLLEVTLKGDGVEPEVISLDFWPEISEGILGVKLLALESSKYFGASFCTTDAPSRNVKLGIVVTTFNRQKQTTAAIKRLEKKLFDDPRFRKNITLTVVDNGRNLTIEASPNVIIIPNPNLGGAGGFSRGLAHLQDDTSYTHALFMDDDATCEIESIRRTFRLLQYARDPAVSVAGAMLNEEEKNIQHENGAVYRDGFVRALKHRLDLSQVGNVIANERPEQVDYAAWWFYAFPLSIVTHLAFPFFVRGDDFTFGVQHARHIVTMNGVATWQERFDGKSGPMVEYLSMRSLVMATLLLHETAKPQRIAKSFLTHIVRDSAGYNYDRARALREAVSDCLKGPEFWRQNVDLLEKRKVIQSLTIDEAPQPFADGEGMREFNPSHHSSKIAAFLRNYVTFNGHLIPAFFFRDNQFRRLNGRCAPVLPGVFRQKRALYYDPVKGTGYWVTHSKRRFFANVIGGIFLYVRFLGQFKRLRRDYRDAYDSLTSREFWQNWFVR
jgi:galactofuranosylgalactofuranosylrhamnosyl-N-acetylglucosaminyl-diphospho-decaprenol beta-1,5/1,6-galactofuranosyltransferase